MIKRAKDILIDEPMKSIVFDETNPSIEKRKEYIEFAKTIAPDHKLKCFYVATPMEVASNRNLMRTDDKKVPRIALSMYNKKFEMPQKNEGFSLHVFYKNIADEFAKKKNECQLD